MYQPIFVKVSHNISVSVKPVYLEEESSSIDSKHVFAYFISIRNLSNQTVKLLRRHWQIEDSAGEDYEVNGEGVIGKQPVIAPNQEYEYNSFCVLKSFRGSMQGYYSMEREDGKVLDIHIPRFLLVSHLLN